MGALFDEHKNKKNYWLKFMEIVVGHEKKFYEEKIFSRNIMEHWCLEYEKK